MNHTETLVRATGPTPGLTVKTRVQAGGHEANHTETLVRDRRPAQSPMVKTHIKAGVIVAPNQTHTAIATSG
jgi:hypothetical protein